MATSITGQPTVLKNLTKISYSITWTGTSPVGTISLQFSNDYALNPNGTVLNAGTWNSVPVDVGGTVASTIPVSGNTGNGFIDVDECAAYASRIIYTAASGTGTMNAIATGKVA
jgi:hypothetical protein